MRQMCEVNVLGAFLTAREAAQRMSKSSGGAGGSIVLMSSAAARLGSPNLYIGYAAFKGAIDTLTLGLAKELGPEGVRVNAIRPGLVDTEIHASGGEPDRARILGATAPLGRPGPAEEIAAAAIWLISDRGFLRDRRASRRLRRALTAALRAGVKTQSDIRCHSRAGTRGWADSSKICAPPPSRSAPGLTLSDWRGLLCE